VVVHVVVAPARAIVEDVRVVAALAFLERGGRHLSERRGERKTEREIENWSSLTLVEFLTS